jgi:alpha-beta hydrolase superfamily lysophospholipase
VFVAEAALHPGRRWLKESDRQQAALMAERHGAALTDADVVGADGSELRGWLLQPRQGNHDFVMLLHGLSDNRTGMIGYAEMFVNRGYGVLMADARAHGASGGLLASYGLVESEDIRRWFEWLSEREHPRCIYGFGESMGAGQLLQSLSTEDGFCAVAAESSFSTFREIAYDRVGQAFHTGPWLGRSVLRPLLEVAFVYAKWKYELDFEKVSPDRVIAASRVPVLLIHGEQDSNIPVRHSRKIAADDPAVTVWVVPGAEHCGAVSVAPEEFERRVVGWFEGHGAEHREVANAVRASKTLKAQRTARQTVGKAFNGEGRKERLAPQKTQGSRRSGTGLQPKVPRLRSADASFARDDNPIRTVLL